MTRPSADSPRAILHKEEVPRPIASIARVLPYDPNQAAGHPLPSGYNPAIGFKPLCVPAPE